MIRARLGWDARCSQNGVYLGSTEDVEMEFSGEGWSHDKTLLLLRTNDDDVDIVSATDYTRWISKLSASTLWHYMKNRPGNTLFRDSPEEFWRDLATSPKWWSWARHSTERDTNRKKNEMAGSDWESSKRTQRPWLFRACPFFANRGQGFGVKHAGMLRWGWVMTEWQRFASRQLEFEINGWEQSYCWFRCEATFGKQKNVPISILKMMNVKWRLNQFFITESSWYFQTMTAISDAQSRLQNGHFKWRFVLLQYKVSQPTTDTWHHK